jgi:hypothetical protein
VKSERVETDLKLKENRRLVTGEGKGRTGLSDPLPTFPLSPRPKKEGIMRSDLTDITLVVDRSGSMEARREDAEGGVNAFIREQAAEGGEARLTLIQFDTEYEVVHAGTPVEEVPEYRLIPRGATALLDAVGRAISETEARIHDSEEKERPGLVVFVVNTDGLENSSREFSRARIRKMIERRQREDGWHFTYLGANQDAFHEAGGMGIGPAGVADVAPDKMGESYLMASRKLSRMRDQIRMHEEVSNEFTDEERGRMK